MLRGRILLLKFACTLLVLGVAISPQGSGAVQAAPVNTPHHDNVVISEFRTRGPGGVDDEFIELFNPTSAPIPIGGWKIWASTSNSSSTVPLFIIPDGVTLASGKHYLVANTGWTGIGEPPITPDGTYNSNTIPDNGGIKLTTASQTVIVDQVGMSATTQYLEGTALFPLIGTENQSYERRPGGSLGSCTDTDNNANDFSLLAPPNYSPDPQNLSSAATTACINSNQTISFTSTPPANATAGGAMYTPTAAATSGLVVIFTVDASASSVCTISAGTVSFIAPGTCVIDANQPGDDPGDPNFYYHAAPQVQQSFTVKQDQTITFTSTAPVNAGVGETYTPTATGGGSSNPVVITIDPGATALCSITGGVVTFNAIGICVIDANQAGDETWNAAPQVQQSIPIRNNQTINFNSTAPTSAVVGGATYTPSATASSGLDVSFSIDASASLVCSFSGNQVSFTGAGTCVIDANQAGNATFNPAPQVQQSFSVVAVATATPTAPTHLVISEFRSRGPLGADDEFVEIYNPGRATVNIGSWTIRASSSCGTVITVLATMPVNTLLLPGQHYLIASAGGSITDPDKTFTAGIEDDGGVGLFNYAGTVQDMAGMCATTTYREGYFLTPLLEVNETLNQSYERKPVGATSCYDTNDNARDFALVHPADPQNMDSPIVMCTGVVPFTPTFTPSRTPTRTPTRAPTAIPGNIVINEILPHPRSDWNEDGTVDSGDEYIELINMGTAPINIANWKLDNGAGTTAYILTTLTLLPRQIAVFYHAGTGLPLSDLGGSVRLVKPDGRTADIINYPLVVAGDRTWCRLPDGNGAWSFACRPTPGRPNEAIKSGTPGPGTGEGAGSICVKNIVPQIVLNAECNSPGGEMWWQAGKVEIWLKSRLKWDSFVE